MADIKEAKASPRLENGNLYWYYGDSVSIKFDFQLQVNGKSYSLDASTDYIVMEVFSRNLNFNSYSSKDTVNQIISAETKGDITTITFAMSLDQSVAFKAGTYKYNIRLIRDSQRDTLINQGTIIVE